MKRLVLEKEAMKKNLAVIKDRAGAAAIYAVLTGDGFGAGLLPLARLLREEGIVRYAVSEVEEAELLRKNGFEQEEILMLRSTTEHDVLERLMDLNVICTIGSYEAGMALNGIAEGRATVVEAHIQVDTGMGFGGFLVSEPEQVLSAYRYLPNVALSGIHTQRPRTRSPSFRRCWKRFTPRALRPASSTPPGPRPSCATTSPIWTRCGWARPFWAAVETTAA